MKSRVNFWKQKGWAPKVIYDIGANIGEWTTEFKNYFPESDFILFEAFEENKSKNIHQNYHTILLDKEDNTIKPFYTTKGKFNTGNSTYIELSHHFTEGNYNTMYIPTKKLDTYVKENNIPLPDFIKIDVQGGELDVLEGGKECMNNANMILLEVSIHQYNKNAPLFADVIKYMNDNNFELIDIPEHHWINNYLAQVDILFSKKGNGYRLHNFYA